VGGASIDTVFAGAYNLAQFCGWEWGRYRHPSGAPRFALTWMVLLVLGLAIAMTGVDAVSLTEYAVIFSVVVLPLTYVPILLVSNDRSYMASHTNGRLANVRLHMGDALDVLDRLPDASLDRAYLLHPDPWPKARHAKRRFMNHGPIGRIAAKFRTQLDLDSVLRVAVEETARTLGAQRAFIRLGDPADLPPIAFEWHTPEVDRIGSNAKRLRRRRSSRLARSWDWAAVSGRWLAV